MNAAALVLAQNDAETRDEMIRRLGRGFNTEVASNELVIVLLGAVVLLVLLLLGREYLTHRRSAESRRRDYLNEALRILGLTRAERETVLRLAFLARLPQPTAMLLSPGNLAHALARGVAIAGETQLRQRLNALSIRLFGRPLPQHPAGPSDRAKPRH